MSGVVVHACVRALTMPPTAAAAGATGVLSHPASATEDAATGWTAATEQSEEDEEEEEEDSKMRRRMRELIFLRLRVIVQIGALAVVDGNFGFPRRLQDGAARDLVFVTDRKGALHSETSGEFL